MTKTKSKALLLPLSWKGVFDELGDKDAAALIRAAFAVMCGEEPKPMKPAASTLWLILKPFIESNKAHYEDVCQKRLDAINKRWTPKGTIVKNSGQDVIQTGIIVKNSGQDVIQTGIKSKSKSKSKSNNIPPNPQRGKRAEGEIKKEWVQRCVGRYYHRRRSTPWSKPEAAKLAEIAARPEALRECAEIMRLYRSPLYPYQRRDVVTLLNNWQGELDRARAKDRAPAQQQQQANDLWTNYKTPRFDNPNERGL